MSKRSFEKKPLYRKVNTKARGVFHNSGPDYRHIRNTKAEQGSEATRGKMRQGAQRGLDYTPLFRFLQSKVGRPWSEVHSEAVARLDKEAPIWWLVAPDRSRASRIVGCGESSYYSGLYVDDEGILQMTDPKIDITTLWPDCPCCTHTLNGNPFPNKYDEDHRYANWEQGA